MYVKLGDLQDSFNINSLFFNKNAARIRNFVSLNAHTTLLFKIYNISKFLDIVTEGCNNLQGCIFVKNYFNKDSCSNFTKTFQLVSTAHSYDNRSAK